MLSSRLLDIQNISTANKIHPVALGLRYDAILEDFQQACKRAKIADGFTGPDGSARTPGLHDLRRTFARVANRAGVPHRTIMEIAGWKSEAMLLSGLR